MNEQIIKERRRTPWIILAGILIVGLMVGAFVLLPDRLPQPGINQQTTHLTTTFTGAIPTPIILQPPASSASSDGKLAVGQPAPDFSLKTLEGGQVSLSQFRGRPVLINFWASWCPPCRMEMPDLVRAYETHKTEGLVILAINLTFQDSIEGAQRFVDEFTMSFPVLLDETGEVTTDLYHLYGLPTSVFVDRDGVITHIQVGPLTGEQIDELVGAILEE